MFSKRIKEVQHKEHYNRPFFRISITKDPIDTIPVLSLEDKRGIYQFENLSNEEEKKLNLAIELFEKSFELSEKILIQFLVDRYHQGGKDAEQVAALAECNRYYERRLKDRGLTFDQEVQEPQTKKRRVESYHPSTRKDLTTKCRDAERIPDLMALDAQLRTDDLSHLYDDSEQNDSEATSDTSNREDQALFMHSKRSQASFFKLEKESKSQMQKTDQENQSSSQKEQQESKSSNAYDGGLSPLKDRQIGGTFAWDSLQKKLVYSSVTQPFISPRVSQELCETTSPQKRKRKRA